MNEQPVDAKSLIDLSVDLKVILAALAIVVAIGIAVYSQWWRNRKKLSYEVISDVALLTASEQIREKIQILYEGKPVKNVQLLILKIVNDGFQPIKNEDFVRPLNFAFVQDAHILSVEIESVNPDNLDVSIKFQDNQFTISPMLLNRKDSMKLKVLVSGYNAKFKIDTRIVGVNKVKVISVGIPKYMHISIFIICFLVFSILIFDIKPLSIFDKLAISCIVSALLTSYSLGLRYIANAIHKRKQSVEKST